MKICSPNFFYFDNFFHTPLLIIFALFFFFSLFSFNSTFTNSAPKMVKIKKFFRLVDEENSTGTGKNIENQFIRVPQVDWTISYRKKTFPDARQL